MIIYNKNRYFKINAYEAGIFKKFSGLMFKSSKSDILLFNFNSDVNYFIHSLFVFFPFYAVWLDKNNRIIEYKLVKPFNFSVKPKSNFRKLLEIPINLKNQKVIEFSVGKRNI